jgi:hypothetical protein
MTTAIFTLATLRRTTVARLDRVLAAADAAYVTTLAAVWSTYADQLEVAARRLALAFLPVATERIACHCFFGRAVGPSDDPTGHAARGLYGILLRGHVTDLDLATTTCPTCGVDRAWEAVFNVHEMVTHLTTRTSSSSPVVVVVRTVPWSVTDAMDVDDDDDVVEYVPPVFEVRRLVDTIDRSSPGHVGQVATACAVLHEMRDHACLSADQLDVPFTVVGALPPDTPRRYAAERPPSSTTTTTWPRRASLECCGGPVVIFARHARLYVRTRGVAAYHVLTVGDGDTRVVNATTVETGDHGCLLVVRRTQETSHVTADFTSDGGLLVARCERTSTVFTVPSVGDEPPTVMTGGGGGGASQWLYWPGAICAGNAWLLMVDHDAPSKIPVELRRMLHAAGVMPLPSLRDRCPYDGDDTLSFINGGHEAVRRHDETTLRFVVNSAHTQLYAFEEPGSPHACLFLEEQPSEDVFAPNGYKIVTPSFRLYLLRPGPRWGQQHILGDWQPSRYYTDARRERELIAVLVATKDGGDINMMHRYLGTRGEPLHFLPYPLPGPVAAADAEWSHTS